MKVWKEKTWQYETAGQDGCTNLFGVNIFDYKWKNTGNSVVIHDPLYGQEHRFTVFSAWIHGEEHIFAAGEFSNNIWGFYLLRY